MNEQVKLVLKNPRFLFIPFLYWFGRGISDEPYLKMMYRLRTGQKLNLESPKTYNEKMQWLKLHDHRTEYKQMADKYAVREFVADKIGTQYLVPFLGVWDSFDEINFDELPNQFVLKCTHDSGSVVICRDKERFNKTAARKKLQKALKRDYFAAKREWCYQGVKPRIIAEEFLGENISDYKIHTFGGQAKTVQVDFDRFINHKRNIYTASDWAYIPLSIRYQTDPDRVIDRPSKLAKMLSIAERLAENIPYMRVDLYFVSGKIYFGEITFYHEAGLNRFTPSEYGAQWGDWIELNTLA